jgi:hypothetical protein
MDFEWLKKEIISSLKIDDLKESLIKEIPTLKLLFWTKITL